MADKDVSLQLPDELHGLALHLDRQETIGRVAITFLRCAAVVGSFALLREPLTALTGRTTLVGVIADVQTNANLEIGTSLDVNWILVGALALSLLANLFLAGVAMSQRRTHGRTVEHLAPTRAEMERLVDAARSSSGLTRQGQTSPEDR